MNPYETYLIALTYARAGVLPPAGMNLSLRPPDDTGRGRQMACTACGIAVHPEDRTCPECADDVNLRTCPECAGPVLHATHPCEYCGCGTCAACQFMVCTQRGRGGPPETAQEEFWEGRCDRCSTRPSDPYDEAVGA